jgi:glycosyltransferase involved in cell wall biosynthesis
LAALARRDGCDVLHCPNGMGPPWSSTPIVLTIHDLSLFRYPHCHPRWRIVTTRRLLPRLARRAAAVVAVSEFTRREILSVLQLPPEKVHTVHSAAAASFRPVTDASRLAAIRQRYGLPERFVLFVGTVEPRKNLHRLVRAFRQVRQRGFPHALILAGHKGWLMEGFAEEIERLGLSDATRRLGYVPDADLPALYSLADLFVYPSLYEGFGLPTLEAMACGTPVLSSNSPALAEVCGDAACLVDPLDEDALADALSLLLRDRDQRVELSRKGLVRAREFSWQRAAEETMAVYARVARDG